LRCPPRLTHQAAAAFLLFAKVGWPIHRVLTDGGHGLKGIVDEA
jgi:hypothetical protein